MNVTNSQTTGKLRKFQRDLDKFKFEVTEFCDDDLPNVGTASSGRTSAYTRACNMQEELMQLEQRLGQLTVKEENMPTKSFDGQKRVEERRLETLKIQLEEVVEQLEPDEVEEDYFRKFNSKTNTNQKPRKSILKSPDNTLDVGTSVNKSVKIGSRRSIYDDDDDDEFYDDDDDVDVEESDGEIESDEFEDEDLDADDDDDDGDEQDGDDDDDVVHIVQALADFNGEQDGDLFFKKGDRIEILEASDDGWWIGRDHHGNEGLVPNTLVKIIEQHQEGDGGKAERGEDQIGPRKSRSGKELWSELREAKDSKTSVTDVLQAMKAVPSGFRSPTLGTWYRKEKYRTSAFIIPKTCESNLQFKDLFWDPIDKKLRGTNVLTCRTISLLSVKCVPPVGAGVEILSRHVYVALWDQEKIISNIHVLRAVPLERDFTWTFTPKIAKNIPSLYDGDIVVRINSNEQRLSLLIELNYSYQRTSTGERSDISCGWVSLPLFDDAGNPMPNKTYELPIQGGTPFDTNVPLDVNADLHASQSLMQSILRTSRQPRMTVKITGFNKLTKESLDLLPETIVTCQRYAPFIGYYRQHAASMFCKGDNNYSGTMFDSILTQFPRGIDYHDLMDALNMVWTENTRTTLNRTQRKDLTYLLPLFIRTFNESVGALLQCSQMPLFKWADETAEKARFAFILAFIQKNDPIGNLLSRDYRFKPLNISKFSYTNASLHAVPPPHITKDM